VFNNSQTARAPLALALSVNDCKSWEPLAMIEEDPKGGWRHGCVGVDMCGWATCGWRCGWLCVGVRRTPRVISFPALTWRC